MVTDITSTEIDGKHWINVNIDGCELERRGPFPSADEAEATAMRIAAVCRAMHTEVHHAVPHAGKPASASRLIMEI